MDVSDRTTIGSQGVQRLVNFLKTIIMENACINDAGVYGGGFINSLAAFHGNMIYSNGFFIPPPVLPQRLNFGEDAIRKKFLPPVVERNPANVCSKASGDWVEATGAPTISYFRNNHQVSSKSKVDFCYPAEDPTFRGEWQYWSGG